MKPEQLRSRGIRIVEDNMYRKKQTGIRTSLFDADEQTVRNLACWHGLDTTTLQSSSQVTTLITHHLIYGHCFRVKESSVSETLPACLHVSAGFDSTRELSDAVVDSLIQHQDDMSKIPPRKLIQIVNAIDYPRLSTRDAVNRHERRDALQRLKTFRKTPRLSEAKIRDIFSSEFEDMSKASAASIAAHHGIQLDGKMKKEEIKDLIVQHFVSGRCMKNVVVVEDRVDTSNLCGRAVSEFLTQSALPHNPEIFNLFAISASLQSLSLKAARRLVRALGIPSEHTDNKSQTVKSIRHWLRHTMKGKTSLNLSEESVQTPEHQAASRRNWPQLVSQESKDKIIALFKEMTSRTQLQSVTCASCGSLVPKSRSHPVSCNDINLECLKQPDLYENELAMVEDRWLDPDVPAPRMPYSDGPLKDVLLVPEGVSQQSNNNCLLTLCRTCYNSVKREEVPPMALANRMFIGDIPPELRDLTVVEEAMIARCRAQCWVVQLREDNQEIVLPTAQRGLKGHIIIYPQNPSRVATILPPSIDDITSPLCVLFVGATPPSEEWLREKAKPLAVRGSKVRNALIWLKQNNRLYKDVIINEEVLEQLDNNPILPFHIETVNPSGKVDELTSGYDSGPTKLNPVSGGAEDIPFENVVISDISGGATSNELRAAAFRHMKRQGKGYIQVGRESNPLNEFNNPAMLPMCYPTLFPYGLGGCDDPHRTNPVSLKRHVKHLFSMRDQRFQLHYSFMFIVFNIIQRREALLRTSLKTKRDNFTSVANEFRLLSAEAIHTVSERASRGDFTVKSKDEQRVLKLMREVNAVTSHVPGSPASKVSMRNKIKALIVDQGLPQFYLTINPADVYNPLVRFLAGSDIDVDRCVPADHNYHEQAMLVAKNPAAAAKFFNIYMQAFIYALLGYRVQEGSAQEGILGKVRAYYGTVEAQGRGTLHCHMMVWVEGGLHPDEMKNRLADDEFRNRLFTFLDDTISTELPAEPATPSSDYHPCTVRGPLSDTVDGVQKDKHMLVLRCQYHTHSKTCYKYDANRCRFELGEGREVRPVTVFNAETGEIEQRCLHSLVNNFNETILSAMRCNMDIKYIGSGVSAKAVIFYITDYITKSQLQAHVAYAALELAYKKLGELNTSEDSVTQQAKKLLQKCVYALISHQELSAQQVVSYLLDFDDHFTSHQFVNVVWSSFENYVNESDPSPECYPHKPTYEDGDAPAQGEQDDGVADNSDPLNPPVNDTLAQDPESEPYYDNEVTLHTDIHGMLVPKTSAVEDYIHRGPALSNVSVWDYFSRVEKVSKKKDKKMSRHRVDDDDEYAQIPPSCDDDSVDSDAERSAKQEAISLHLLPELWDLHFHPNPLLTNIEHHRPRVNFASDHRDSDTHYQKVRTRMSRLVPVPIGPAIPRRDREELKEKHARLMLVLFKPWATPRQLREPNRSWSQEYSLFVEHCDARVRHMIDNMQVLHECRDARDDHFASRAKHTRSARPQENDQTESNHLGEEMTDNLLHEHLMSIQDYQSDNVAKTSATAAECLASVNESGYFVTDGSQMNTDDTEVDVNSICVSGPKDNQLELIWNAAYEQRRLNAKLAFMSDVHVEGTIPQSVDTLLAAGLPPAAEDITVSMMDVDQATNPTQVDTVHPGHLAFSVEHSVDIGQLAKE